MQRESGSPRIVIEAVDQRTAEKAGDAYQGRATKKSKSEPGPGLLAAWAVTPLAQDHEEDRPQVRSAPVFPSLKWHLDGRGVHFWTEGRGVHR